MTKSTNDSKQVKRGMRGLAAFFSFIFAICLIGKLGADFIISGIQQVRETSSILQECMYCGERATVCLSAGKSGVLSIDADKIAHSAFYYVNGQTYERTTTGYIPRTDRYLVPDEKGWRLETEHRWEEKTHSDGTGSYTTVTGFYCDAHRNNGERLIIRETIYAYTLKSVSFWILVIGVSLPWILVLIGTLRPATAEGKAALETIIAKVLPKVPAISIVVGVVLIAFGGFMAYGSFSSYSYFHSTSSLLGIIDGIGFFLNGVWWCLTARKVKSVGMRAVKAPTILSVLLIAFFVGISVVSNIH